MKLTLPLALTSALAVFGLLTLLSGLTSAAQALIDPPDEDDLLRAKGVLTKVTQCSMGRHSEFSFSFTTPTNTTEATLTCPNHLRDEMSRSVGAPITALYRVRRGWLFTPEVEVYEIRTAETVFWSYQAKAENARQRRGLFVAIFLGIACCGGMIFRHNAVNLPKLLGQNDG